ncbi:putative nuclease HARBI1 [Monomorium pharaonis]|uniref:putative nuclease HARBI1 n=1 Tax=Monomorium pharaonis TaxID=307658 RepID=UPI001745D69A|nr:putative nuclease HARBI1 [Monomorium pharaonis]
MRFLVPSPPPSPVPGVIALDDFAPDEGKIFEVFEDFVENAGEFLMDDGEIEEESVLDEVLSGEESDEEDQRHDSPELDLPGPEVDFVVNPYFFRRVLDDMDILDIEDESGDERDSDFGVPIERYIVRDVSPDGEDKELPKIAIQQLIEKLIIFMPISKRVTAIPPYLQIFTTIHFVASGSYQRRVGQDFLSCMSQTSISVHCHNTIKALNDLMGQWIQFPISNRKKQQIKQEFFEKTGFPGVIGAIDGSHIAIFPPQNEREHLFINRKLYHSLNIMIVSSYNGEILAVNAQHGGRTHDSRAFRSSNLFHHLESNRKQYRIYFNVFLGDSAYPLLPFLLKPILNAPEGSPEAKYTQHFVKARCAVERCIRVLKGRWRCLRKERALHYQPEIAACIIIACCVLHNIAIKWKIPPEEIFLDEIDIELPIPENINNNNAEEIRRNIVRWYFTE